MRMPQTPYDAVLHAARDVTRVETAFDAEMLGTALLGSVYEIAGADRATALRGFVSGFLTFTADRPTLTSGTISQVFAALVPEAEGAGTVRLPDGAPRWSGQLGRVRLTGSYAYGDVFGDQTSYLATFAYDDEEAGGPEHAVVSLVDHNIGIVKDVFVGGPAERIVAQARDACEADSLTWFTEVAPGRLRGEVRRHLEITDELTDLPGEGSLATDRALVGARLATLPDDGATPPPAPAGDLAARADLITDFLGSPQARAAGLLGLAEVENQSLHYCLSLIMDHAAGFPDPDPLRMSPAVAGLLLLDWVHRRAVLDDDDAVMLPRVVQAWATWAAQRRGLPPDAVAHADSAIAELGPEFARLYASGERSSAEADAVRQLLAEGVDPADPAALEAWLSAHPPHTVNGAAGPDQRPQAGG